LFLNNSLLKVFKLGNIWFDVVKANLLGKKNSSKVKSRARKSMRVLMAGSLAWSIFFQTKYCIRGNITTERRTAFEQELGFPILGYLEDVEQKEGNISKIANAVHREKVHGPFEMNSIRISSSNYWRKSIAGQLEHLLFQGGEAYTGIAPPDLDRIYLNNDFSPYTIMHELCHVKSEKIHDANPEFKEKWVSLALDDDGNTHYTSLTLWFLSKLRFIGDHIKVSDHTSEENEKDGFINSYSRYWWYEDAAEVCEEAGSRYLRTTIRQIYDDKNARITAKFKLAQEYGLIPAEFLDYLKVEKAVKDDDETYESANKILEIGKAFLEEHPETVYEITIRNKMGKLLEESENYERAIAEYKLGLQANYKDHVDYKDTLHRISICHAQLGSSDKMKLYEEAEKRYEKGWKDNDIKTAIHGVNDFLKGNGEKF